MSADSTDADGDPLPIGRFGRLVTLVAFVTAVFLLTAAEALPDRLFSIAVVVIGVIAIVTAITGFLISVASVVGAP